MGKGRGENVGKGTGIRSIIGRYKIDWGRLRIVGNEEAKELICMTHRHELSGWGISILEGMGVPGRGG